MAKYFILLLSILLLVSCEKELDFTYHDIEPQLVVEGILDQEGIRVTLSETTPMNEKIEEDYITDAEVYLLDETTQDITALISDNSGIYRALYPAELGHIYLLEVRRGGSVYSSRCMMREAADILAMKFQWIKMPYDYVAVLQITFEALEEEDSCYWIKVYRNDEPYKWIVTDNRAAYDGVINEVIMTSRKDLDQEDEKDILREGDEVKVSINTVS